MRPSKNRVQFVIFGRFTILHKTGDVIVTLTPPVTWKGSPDWRMEMLPSITHYLKRELYEDQTEDVTPPHATWKGSFTKLRLEMLPFPHPLLVRVALPSPDWRMEMLPSPTRYLKGELYQAQTREWRCYLPTRYLKGELYQAQTEEWRCYLPQPVTCERSFTKPRLKNGDVTFPHPLLARAALRSPDWRCYPPPTYNLRW